MACVTFSFQKTGKSFKLQQELLKKEMKHEDVYGDTCEKRKMNGWILLKTMFYVVLFHMLGILNQWQN